MKKIIILILMFGGLVLGSMATMQAIFDRDYTRSVVTLAALVLLVLAVGQRISAWKNPS